MRLDRYVIGEPLGAGGMGEVHRARDETLERDVAIKVMNEGLGDTEQFAARRSGYLASIVAYSGARLGTVVEEQLPANKYPAMLFHGGPNDTVVVNFAEQQNKYHEALTAEGHFSFICDHGKGHTVPSDGRAAAWQFLQDHPYGTQPEPYLGGLPVGFPSYCSL